MKERRHRNPVRGLCLCLVLFIFIATSAAEDYTPPGGSGGGSIILGEPTAGVVSFSAPSGISNWILSPADGMNTHAGTFTVSADCNWQVTVSDQDTTNTNGYMTEWDGSNYVASPIKLASPMSVAVATGGDVTNGYEVTLPGSGTVAEGATTGGSQKNIDVTFKQPVYWTDTILNGDHTYRIVITFSISSDGS